MKKPVVSPDAPQVHGNTAVHRLRRGLVKQWHVLTHLLQGAMRWSVNREAGIRSRRYRSYSQYLEHQKSKLSVLRDSPWLARYDVEYREALRSRLADDGAIIPGMTVLCLAARLGTEVKAFLDLGCFAVGLDLNPGEENPYVVYGDFHHLQFPDGSVDAVFTNSLDHALDLRAVAAEVRRVVKPNGVLILELGYGRAEGGSPSRFWESTEWQRMEDVLAFFEEDGFTVECRREIEYPCDGHHVVLRNSGPPTGRSCGLAREHSGRCSADFSVTDTDGPDQG